jgi:uncharacterized protein
MKMNPVVHFEMPAIDRKRVAVFYSRVFGWKMNQLGPEMGNYVLAVTTETDEKGMIKTPGAINGGFFTKDAVTLDQCPHVVIGVGDIHEFMKSIETAGGTVLGEPMEIPGVGWYVSFRDTEGNTVGILQPTGR